MKELFSTISNNMYVQFLYGTAGIYIFAFISSIIHEKLYLLINSDSPIPTLAFH